MDDLTQEILNGIDPETFYQKYLPDIEFSPTGQSVKPVICCFHEDDKPSLSVHLEKGFNCHACGAKGPNPIKFRHLWKTRHLHQNVQEEWAVAKCYDEYVHPLVPLQIINAYHKSLLQNMERMTELDTRGIHRGLIMTYKIGWNADDERFSIPIKNKYGWYSDLRMIKNGSVEEGEIKNLPYDFKTSKKKKENGEMTYGEGGRLFPIHNIKKKKIFLCEGEWDAMLLHSWGYNSLTAGSVTDLLKHAAEFQDREVYIVFDNDQKEDGTNPGQEAAYKLTKAICKYRGKGTVRNILLPLWGDVTDYWRQGNSKENFQSLVDNSLIDDIVPEQTEAEETPLVDITLEELSDTANYDKAIRTRARIVGEDPQVFTVAHKYGLRCGLDYGDKICPRCPMSPRGGEMDFEHDINDNFLLSLITIKDSLVMGELKRRHDIESRCSKVKKVAVATTTIQKVIIAPILERKQKTITRENILAYNFSDSLDLNVDYDLEGYITHDPHTQQSAFIILKAIPKDTLVDSFEAPTEEEVAVLVKKFGPAEVTPDAIVEKYHELNEIHAHNHTNIYKRSHLHGIMDLTFHSPLQIYFDKLLVRSYMETLIVGDTNTGKNEVLDQLNHFYGNPGVVLDAGSTTPVGLIGGMAGGNTSKRCFTWGTFVQQHRRLIGLDEGSHLSHTIAALRVIREGKADYNKADAKRQTVCMCRVIIMANDPDGKVSSNPQGILAMPKLFEHAADISRFTAAFFLSEEDTPTNIINSLKPPKIKTDITQEDFQFVLLNAWALQPENIDFTPDAVKKCYELALKISNKYRSTIALVQSAVQAKKLATISAALAARQYHMSADGRELIITEAHVEAAARIMQEWYDDTACSYDEFADNEQAREVITDAEEITDYIIDTENRMKPGASVPALQQLLSTRNISHQMLSDSFLFITDTAMATTIIKVLMRNNCLIRRSRDFVKTPVFVKFLKELLRQQKKELQDDE